MTYQELTDMLYKLHRLRADVQAGRWMAQFVALEWVDDRIAMFEDRRDIFLNAEALV